MSDSYAPDWTDEERAQWKDDYAANRPVLLPHVEHYRGECDHCDLLHQLMREVDEDDDDEDAWGLEWEYTPMLPIGSPRPQSTERKATG